MRSSSANGGFTLVEVLVSMSLGMMVMAAVFSTYLYLGRNLTRLSYRSVMESQSRKILNTFAGDVRNTTSIASPSSTSLTLKMIDGTTVVYGFSANKFTRNVNGSGPIVLNYDIGDANVQVPVTMPDFSFLYFTTTGTSPTFQSTTTLVPMSIKQVAMTFTLQAGDASIQGQQGTLSSYPVASGRMPLINRSLPDGS